jgi:hypothetical protein
MSTYTPDTWQVVKFQRGSEVNYKVFAGWYGGYGGSDSWKLSSGIVGVKQCKDRYEFTNHSGSLYVCYMARNKLSGYQHSVLNHWEKELSGTGAVVEIVPVKDIKLETV